MDNDVRLAELALRRELLSLRPTPEFEAWMERMGLMSNGRLTGMAGDLSVFLR